MTFVLGLTGGIASGKTTVANFFKERQIPVIDADQVAREVVEPGKPALAKIVQKFGPDYLDSSGQLDRKRLGDLVFHDNSARIQLNQLLDDYIRSEIEDQREKYKLERVPLLVIDIPLLYEAEYDNFVDRVMLVYVPEELQLERLMKRNQLSKEAALARIHSQWSMDKKLSLADVVIDNSGTQEETYVQCKKWLEDFYNIDKGGRRPQ